MSVEQLFNIGHAHDPVAETQGLLIGLGWVGAVALVFGIIFLINYIRKDKKK